MDTRTGRIVDMADVEAMPESEARHFVPITRDLTVQERNEKQIRMYSLCGCGSGKKFKFCCYKGDKSHA
jgi:uncharacterized protein YchJ